MVEGARLESVYRLTPIEGSNPSVSAICFPSFTTTETCRQKPPIAGLFRVVFRSTHGDSRNGHTKQPRFSVEPFSGVVRRDIYATVKLFWIILAIKISTIS